MKLVIEENGAFMFRREASDRKYYGMALAKGEHALFRFIAKWLNAHGFDVIKKRAQKDGHMVGDEYQPYIRCRNQRKDVPHIYIISGFYALRGANEDWNKDGEVTLNVHYNVWDKDQKTGEMVRALHKQYPADIWWGGESSCEGVDRRAEYAEVTE